MATEGSVEDDVGAPESWEVADLDESMSRLMLSTSNMGRDKDSSKSIHDQLACGSGPGPDSSEAISGDVSQKVADDAINQVDQFLREALQNPRERLSVLRIEQDVEKFIRDPMQQQMEFQQLPTSYLRLAAHRVAQHYSLQSMVPFDNCLPDGSGSRIIVRKTSECRHPAVRLADIPINLPPEENGVLKVAIKQRPQKNSPYMNNTYSNSSRSSSSKSVEERKEEYNKARARIFNSSNNVSGGASGKPETESQHGSLVISKIEDKSIPSCCNINAGRGIADSSTGSGSRAARTRAEKEPLGRYRPNNRVAIFRDREVERKDPDYDRSYDRYMQRFDPGFGFNGGPYSIQPLYTPAINYNTEFPQLAPTPRPQISAEPQHLPGPWAAQSATTRIGYAHPETIMTQYSPNHIGAHSTSGIYLPSSQYPSQRPEMPFIHSHEHIHQSFMQSHLQPDSNFGLARPR